MLLSILIFDRNLIPMPYPVIMGYTNDLKIDLKGYDRLYFFYYSIESIQILVSLRYVWVCACVNRQTANFWQRKFFHTSKTHTIRVCVVIKYRNSRSDNEIQNGYPLLNSVKSSKLKPQKQVLLYLSSILLTRSYAPEPNPGPRAPKHPCGQCSKAVTWQTAGRMRYCQKSMRKNLVVRKCRSTTIHYVNLDRFGYSYLNNLYDTTYHIGHSRYQKKIKTSETSLIIS
jgi:hypothetical protein